MPDHAVVPLHKTRRVKFINALLGRSWPLGWEYQPMTMLDKWGHKLHLPPWIQNTICESFDVWVGLYGDDDPPDDYAEEDCS